MKKSINLSAYPVKDLGVEPFIRIILLHRLLVGQIGIWTRSE